MEYLSELPEISSMGVNGDSIELELEQRVGKLPDFGKPVVLTAKSAGQIVVTTGEVIMHEDIQGAEVWSRIKIKGSSVTFTI